MNVRYRYNDDLSCDDHDIIDEVHYWLRAAYSEISIHKDDYSGMYYVEAFCFQKMRYQEIEYYTYSEAKQQASLMKKATFEDITKVNMLIRNSGWFEQNQSQLS
mgnify:CR=1 FL=1